MGLSPFFPLRTFSHFVKKALGERKLILVLSLIYKYYKNKKWGYPVTFSHSMTFQTKGLSRLDRVKGSTQNSSRARSTYIKQIKNKKWGYPEIQKFQLFWVEPFLPSWSYRPKGKKVI
jgi:hypothetical protein